MLIIIIAIIIVCVVIAKGNGFWAAKTRNSVVSWATGQEGFCIDCKHCRHDSSMRYSDTEYVCVLSKCKNITPETRMNCFEKPKVTENDLQEIFKIGLWNDAGKQYIRQSLLGKAMVWSELDAFMKRIPYEHPEFMDPQKQKELRNQ